MKFYAGGHLTFYMPGRRHSLEIALPQPAPLREVLTQLGIPLPEVALTAVNGELVEAETVMVRDEDVVKVFSAVNGG